MKKDKSDLDLARTDLVMVLAVVVVCGAGVCRGVECLHRKYML